MLPILHTTRHTKAFLLRISTFRVSILKSESEVALFKNLRFVRLMLTIHGKFSAGNRWTTLFGNMFFRTTVQIVTWSYNNSDRVYLMTVSNVCTWFYVAAQMTHSVDDIAVTWKRITHFELRPTLIIQYLNHYVVERTTVAFYVCTAVVPRATMISQCKIKLPMRMNHNYLYKILQW